MQVGCRQATLDPQAFSSMSTHMQNALPYHTSRFATLAFPESGALPKRRGWPSCNMLYSQPLRARTNRSRMSMRSMHWRTQCTKKGPARVLTTRRTLERLGTAIIMRFCCDPAGQALRARCTFRHRQARRRQARSMNWPACSMNRARYDLCGRRDCAWDAT